MSNDIIATCHPWSHIPPGVIFRGKSGKELKLEFKADKPPTSIKEKLVEAKTDGTVVFKKPGETTKTSAELIKEGKPPKKTSEIKVEKVK